MAQERLPRGEWSLVDSETEFGLTIRHGLGLSAVLAGVATLVWLATGVVALVAGLALSDTLWEAIPMVGLFFVAGFFRFFGAVSSWWLAFGYTQVESDGHEVVLRFVGNYFFRREYRYKRVDFAKLSVDSRWQSATSIPVLGGYGFIPFFGPLCFHTWDGYDVHIGGNLSTAEAGQIAEAVSQFADPQPAVRFA